MNGVFATVRLMFTAVQLQRWLVWAGALLALLAATGIFAGALGSPVWWTPIALIGAPLLLAIFVPFIGGALLRYLSVPRTVHLMPHGRLQLFVGSLFAQILFALVFATVGATLVAYSGNPQLHGRLAAEAAASAVLFVCSFGVATLAFVTIYYLSAYRLAYLGVVAYAIISKVFSVVFSHRSFADFVRSGPALLLVFIGALSIWVLFGVAYLSAGRIKPVLSRMDGLPVQWFEAKNTHTQLIDSERNATRVLLTGRSLGRRITRSLIGVSAGLFCFYCLWTSHANPAFNAGVERLLAVMNSYVAGIAAAAATQPMIARARYLWLKTALDRGQLFRVVEAEGWRTLLSVGVFVLAISAYLCFIAQVPWEIIVQLLLLSFVSGAAMIYVVLLSTREWPVMDALLVTTLSALWFVGGLASAFGGGSRLLWLLAPELLLVPLLRIWARSRWARIDWIVNRPLRLPGR